ncbi:uncharacterized protein LOC141629772 [Silene latifolia]|uniref:uncharacterized protein LOC141629772 n=1 Tax=Silene latifolia TaxID=37657 RepID=UPI003D76D330
MTTAEALKQINDTLVAMMERLTAVEAKIAVEAPIPPPPETKFEKRFRLIEEQLKLSRWENVHYENARGLSAQGKLNPIGPTPDPLADRQGKWYKQNAYCAYHQGKGHDTENCYRLKHEIQDMIENGSLPIPTVRPNNLNNPFGDHANAVFVEDNTDVSHLIQPICHLTGFFVGKVYVSCSEYIPQAKNEVRIGDFAIDCTPYILRSENEINGVWADDEDDIYLTEGAIIPRTQEEISKLRKDVLESNHLTRSGRPYRVEKANHVSIFGDSPSKTPTKEATSVRALGEGSTSEASLIKQLQKTKADVSIWELMLSSFEHRQALLQALMNMTVSPHITPYDVVSFVAQNQPRLTNAITFSDEDLPSFGPQHCLAMYITVECHHKRLPMTLVDDGSAVNVLPLRTAFILGLEKSDFAPTTQTVRAFDGTVRRVSGLVTLSVNVGKVERKVNFQVIDVASSFNILLGRPWIHTAGAVSSTLHRKIKIPLKGEVVTIDATPIIVMGGDVTSEVQTDNTAFESCGFEVVNAIESTFEAPNMDLYTGIRVCKTIFKTEKYFGYSMYPRRKTHSIEVAGA